MRAKKSLGQNFLKSERALSKIVESGEIKKSDTILEIGPGTGALTERLLATGTKVVAVEKDDNLFELLKEKLAKEISTEKLELIHDDILNFNFENWKLKIENYKLIANIPYNITGAILEKFLSSNHQPSLMVLLVQKEVAERIVGGRGSHSAKASRDKKESILSISVKAYGTPRYVETVKAGSFVPAPKVDSAILLIENISKDFFKEFSEVDFFRMVKAGFSSKRKKLSSNLKNIFEKNTVDETFKKLGFDENIRAEEMTACAWEKLGKKLYS